MNILVEHILNIQMSKFECCYVNIPYENKHTGANTGANTGEFYWWRFHVCVCSARGKMSICYKCGSRGPDCINGGCPNPQKSLYSQFLSGMIPRHAVVRQADVFEDSSIIFPESLFSQE